jgi:MFS family permease
LLKGVTNSGAVGALVLSRLIYGTNWFNLSSVYTFMSADLGQGVSGLGLITASFALGIGLFQLPSGILAARIGPRKVTILGTLLASSAVLLLGFVTDFYQVVVLRFFIGAGMAMSFATGITLIATYFRRGSEGLGTGLLFFAYSIGGGVGIFGWVILAQLTSWRLSFVLGGFFGLVSGLVLYLALPPDSSMVSISYSEIRSVITDRWLIALGLGLIGIGTGQRLVGDFMVYYQEEFLKVDPALAGFITSFALLFALISAPAFGRLYDTVRDVKRLLMISGAFMALGVGAASVGTAPAVVLSTALVGLAFGAGTTVGFSASRDSSPQGSQTMAVSWANAISLLGGSWSPILFSQIVVLDGFSAAWLLGGVYTFLLLIPIFFAAGRSTHRIAWTKA